VVEVADTFCPWNHGRYVLSSSPQGSDCQRTAAPADLELDVDVLAALYLGGNRFSTLQRARRINELAPGAIARADAMFRGDHAPWSPSHF
jgi:predicted acetyltransferase